MDSDTKGFGCMAVKTVCVAYHQMLGSGWRDSLDNEPVCWVIDITMLTTTSTVHTQCIAVSPQWRLVTQYQAILVSCL